MVILDESKVAGGTQIDQDEIEENLSTGDLIFKRFDEFSNGRPNRILLHAVTFPLIGSWHSVGVVIKDTSDHLVSKNKYLVATCSYKEFCCHKSRLLKQGVGLMTLEKFLSDASHVRYAPVKINPDYKIEQLIYETLPGRDNPRDFSMNPIELSLYEIGLTGLSGNCSATIVAEILQDLGIISMLVDPAVMRIRDLLRISENENKFFPAVQGEIVNK